MPYLNVYLFYMSTITFSVLCAWIASTFTRSKISDRKAAAVFWTLSFLCLWFVMGFRFEIGVDYFNYKLMFNKVADLGLVGYYQAGYWNEPGYVLLLYLVNLVYGDFTGVFVCTSFISLLLIYRAFAFEAERIHVALCVFIFATTQYFYYFGIDRLFLAVSIITYGLRFIILGRNKKYYLTVLIAACFHISALFMVVNPFLIELAGKNRHRFLQNKRLTQPKIKVIYYFWLLCLIPFLFYILTLIIPYLPAKYQGYGQVSEIQNNLISIAMKLPVALIVLSTMKRTISFYPSSILYSVLYVTSLIVQAFSGIAGVGRLGWYFWISLCFIFPIIIKSLSKNFLARTSVLIFLVTFCIGYMFYAYLGANSSRFEFMFPYKNLFFTLY